MIHSRPPHARTTCACLLLLCALATSCGKAKTEDLPFAKVKQFSDYITLGKYKGVPYEAQPETVTQAEALRQALAYFNQQGGELAFYPDATKTKVANGDVVLFDFEGKADDVPESVLYSMKSDNYQLTVGSGNFIPGFEEQMVGQSLEKAFDVQVTFPEGYGSSQDGSDVLAGKAAVFRCVVHQIGTVTMTNQGVAKLMNGAFTTTTAFVDYIKEKLVETKHAANQQAAFDAAFANAKILALPEGESDFYLNELKRQADVQDLSPLEVMRNNGFSGTLEEYTKQVNDVRVPKDLFAHAVAQRENLELSTEDVQAVLRDLRGNTNTSEDELYRIYGANTIRRNALYAKVRAFLFDNAKKTDPKEPNSPS